MIDVDLLAGYTWTCGHARHRDVREERGGIECALCGAKLCEIPKKTDERERGGKS